MSLYFYILGAISSESLSAVILSAPRYGWTARVLGHGRVTQRRCRGVATEYGILLEVSSE